jgi:hypothetical protein
MQITKLEKVVFGALVVVSLLACKKLTEKAGGGTAAGSASAAEGSTEGAEAPSAEAVGVPECDEFLTKYEKCVKEKMPEAARPSTEASVKQMRDSWRQAASASPATKASLGIACKQAMETTKTSLQAYGCTW